MIEDQLLLQFHRVATSRYCQFTSDDRQTASGVKHCIPLDFQRTSGSFKFSGGNDQGTYPDCQWASENSQSTPGMYRSGIILR